MEQGTFATDSFAHVGLKSHADSEVHENLQDVAHFGLEGNETFKDPGHGLVAKEVANDLLLQHPVDCLRVDVDGEQLDQLVLASVVATLWFV